MNANLKRKLLIGSIFLIVLFISIGFALYSQKLQINGNTAIKDNSWIIYFDNIVKQDGSIQALNTEKEARIIDREKTQIRFEVNFQKPGDKYEFIVDIVNDGTIDAMIDEVVLNGFEGLSDVFTWSVTYLDGTPVKRCDVLLAKSRRPVRVVANYGDVSDKNDLPVQTKTVQLTFDVRYIQRDDNTCDINEDPTPSHSITVNPNGGTYLGSTSNTVVTKKVGESYVLDVPVWEEHEFTGWEVTPSDGYDTDSTTINMGEENVVAVAQWNEIVPDSDYTITVDPKGGTYDGREGIFTKGVNTGEVYVLLKPIKPGFDFIGWTVTPNTGYTEDSTTIIVADYDVLAEANWEEKAVVDIENAVARNRTTDVLYETIQAAFDEALNGQEIELLKNTTESPVNSARGSILLDLLGHHVTGTLTNNGTLTMVNSVRKEISWFENLDNVGVINNGTFTLGENDGYVLTYNPVSDETWNQLSDSAKESIKYPGVVALIGSSTSGFGIKNNSLFNFYDGYLEADVGISGDYNLIPEGYDVYVDHNDEKDCQRVYLTKDTNRAVAKTIQNGKRVLYYNLQDAFDSSMDYNGELVVYAIRDFEAAYPLHVDAEKSVTFDLDGWDVETGELITNNGELNLKDSKNGLLEPSVTIDNTGSLNISNINITETTDANVITNSGSVDIKASVVKALTGYALYNVGETTITGEDDGILDSDNYAVYNESVFELDGGCIKGVRGGIYNKATVILTGGKIDTTSTSGNSYGIYNDNGSAINKVGRMTFNVTATGGTAYAIYNGSGTSEFKDTTVTITGKSANGVISSTGSYGVVYGELSVTDSKFVIISNEGATGLTANNITLNNIDLSVNGNSVTGLTGGRRVDINGGKIDIDGGVAITSSGATNYIENNAIINATSNCANMGHYAGGSLVLNSGILTCGGKGINSWAGVVINGGEIHAVDDGYYGYSVPYGSSSFSMTGGKIYSETGYGIHHNVGNNVTIGAADSNKIPYIESKKIGVYMQSGSLTIPKAEVISHDEYGVYVNSTTVIGVDDGDNIKTDYPSLRGASYGLYINGGTTDFYDGILKGQTDGYYGHISGIPDGAELTTGTEEIDGDLYITWYLKTYKPFAQVGDEKFNSLQKAIDYIEESGTIKIIDDAVTRSTTTIPSDKSITLDLHGFELRTSKALVNKGNLTIVDNSNEKTGKFIGETITISNEKTLTADHVYLGVDSTVSGAFIVSNANGSAVSTFDGCTLDAKTTTGTVAALHSNSGTLNVNQGTINVAGPTANVSSCTEGGYGAMYGTANYDETTIVVNSTGGSSGIRAGNITLDNVDYRIKGTSVVALTGGGRVDINGGLIDVDGGVAITYSGAATYINDNAVINATGNCSNTGSYAGGYAVLNSGVLTCGGAGFTGYGRLTMNGGEIHAVGDGYNGRSVPNGSSSFTMTGGKIYSETGYGVYHSVGNVVSIGSTDGEDAPYIEAKKEGIYIASGTLKLTNGTVISHDASGVYLKSNSIIGDNSNDITVSAPVIQGETYGVYNGGCSISFYDGILKGKEWGYFGAIDIVPDGYTIKDDEETIGGELFNTAYLIEADNFLSVNGTLYNSLSKAIDAIEDEGTIEVIANGAVRSPSTIPSSKNITWDFKGYSVIVTSQIKNQGTLTITDTSNGNNGGLVCQISTCLHNEGTLTVTGGIHRSEYNYLFYNSKYMFIEDGATIESNAQWALGNYTNSDVQAVTTMNGGLLHVLSEEGEARAFSSGRSYSYYSYGKFILNDGTIQVKGKSTAMGFSYTNVQINGGTVSIESTDATAYGLDRSDLTMVAGTLNVTSEKATAYGTNSNTVSITNGIINVQGKQTNGYGINSNGTINDVTLTSSGDCLVGSLTINGGTYTCGRYGINTKDTTYLKGGVFNTVSNAIQVGGYTNVTGGVYDSSEGYGLFMNYSGRTLNIGDLDGDIDIATPSIKGDLYGVYIQNGTFNFYDGILKGQTDGLYGQIYTTEPSATVYDDEETINEVLYQTDYLVINGDVIKNVTRNISYNNIQSALDEAEENDEFEMLQNASVSYEINVANDKNVTIDMKGFNITSTKTIVNDGIVSLLNTSLEESKITTSLAFNFITNNGTMTINNVFINYPSNSSSVRPLINNGTMTLTKAKVVSQYYGIENKTGKVLNINGNTSITGTNTAILNYGKVEIENSTIVGNSYGIYVYSGSTSNITNTTITSTNAIYVTNTAGENTITDCTINGQVYNGVGSMTLTGGSIDGNVNNASTANISGVDISRNVSGGYNLVYNTGTLDISDSSITLDVTTSYNYTVSAINNYGGSVNVDNNTIKLEDNSGTAMNYRNLVLRGFVNDNEGTFVFDKTGITIKNGKTSYGIYNNSSVSNADLDNLDISITGGGTAYGVYNNSGILNIKTTDNVKKSKIIVSADDAYGIYINNENAYVNLGIDDADAEHQSNVSTTDPLVSAMGTTSGIGVRKVNGHFNFYDGKLIGSTLAKPDTTSNASSRFEARFFLVFDDDTEQEIRSGDEGNYEYKYEYSIIEYLGPENQG